MGMYRTDMRHNTAKIAVNVGVREQIESGVGAWRLVTQYEDNDPTSNNQVIRRLPIHEACSHVIWDANSKQMDKSDAKHCTVINALSRNGWKEFAEDYGIDPDTLPSFQNPNDTWLFPWVSNDVVYVAEYYEVEEKKEKVFIYRDPLTGEPVSYYQQDIKDVIDDLANRGFIKVSALEYATTRKKSEVVYSGVSVTIPTAPTNLVSLLKTLTPSSGTLAPFFDTVNNKMVVFNENKTLFFKLSIVGTWPSGTANRSMQLTFSGSVPDTLVSSRNSATTTDNILLATFFSVDKDGFLATNGSTLTIQSNGAAFTATTIKIIAEQ